MREIILTQGKFAPVDDSDFDWLNTWDWYADKHKHTYYARRDIRINGKRKSIYMHRLIMDTPDNMEVDHQDHNGLNCQRHNMRNATHGQNCMNKTTQKESSSKYLGVHFENYTQKWRAEIALNSKRYKLGRFINEIDAALAYNKKASELFGEFANLNIIN